MKIKSLKKQVFTRISLIGVVMLVLATMLVTTTYVPRELESAINMAERSGEEIVKRMENIMSLTENYTENLALSVSQNADIQRYFEEPTDVNQNISILALNNLTSYEGVVRAVAMEVGEVPLLDSLSRVCEEDEQLLNSDWYHNIKKNQFNRTISNVYKVAINGVEYYTIAYVRSFYQNNQWCTFVVFISLNDVIYDTLLLKNSGVDCFALRNKDGSIFFQGGNNQYYNCLEENVNFYLNPRMITPKGVLCTSVADNNLWSVETFVSNRMIMSTLLPYVLGIIATIATFLVLTLAAVSKSLGTILRPIIQLSKTMDQAAQGNLDSYVKVDRLDEIGTLERSYNKMIDDLQASIRLISEKEEKEQQAKFRLLVSQIDPHFICNTINSINYLARKGRCEDIVKVNTALIAIIRDRLRVNDIQVMDTIAKEMNVIEQYISIQRFMYGGELEVVWDVEEDIKQQMIPKNMIQPLVENALFHGILNEMTGQFSGRLIIRLHKTQQGIDLCVIDDGIGMDEACLNKVLQESLAPTERGNKIGLSNIRKRLYYFFGNDNAMTIVSKPNRGTAITLHLPSNL